MRLRTTVFSTLLMWWACSPALAVRLHVNAATGDDRRSVQSAQDPETPFRSISQAVKVAHLFNQGKPHVVDIAAGTYSPSLTAESFPIVISESDIYLRSAGSVIVDAQSTGRMFEVTAVGASFVLRDFSLIGARADSGAVVSCQACSLRIAENIITSNTATGIGDLVYIRDGQLSFSNNIVRFNGESGGGSLLEIHNTFADTTRGDTVRNNTFFSNRSNTIVSSGNRADISSNVFSGGEGVAIVDSSTTNDPLVRYNLFWETDILYLSDDADSIKVVRTVRDTVTLEELDVSVPDFFTNEPDTVVQVGTQYEYAIGVEGDSSFYIVNALTLPLDASESLVESNHIIRFTPTLADTGVLNVLVEFFPPGGGSNAFLDYRINVFTEEDFPDTTGKGPTVNVSFVPDTTGAITNLNALVPAFSSAASAQGNLYGDPLFLNTDINRFELLVASPGRDAGNPIIALRDNDPSGTGLRNDAGRFGGPLTAGPPAPGTHAGLVITTLPDSVAVIGQAYTYAPVLDPNANVIHVDLLQGPPTLTSVSGVPPLSWTPTEADTGKFIVEAQSFTQSSNGRHFWTLRVKLDNEPPFINSSPPTQAFEDSLLTYGIDAVDLDDDPITYTLVAGPDGLTLDSLGVVRWTPAQDDVGSAAVDILLTDPDGAQRSHAFALTVVNTNDAPAIAEIPDTSIVEDAPFQLALIGFGSDIDPGDSLSYSVTTAPDSVVVDSLGNLVWTPVQTDVGVNLVTLQVSDIAGATDTTQLAVTVLEIDDTPVINSTPDTSAFEDSLFSYAVAAVDEEGATLGYAIAAGPEAMSVDTTGTIRWTPAAGDTGDVSVSVLVSDPAGNSVTQAFVLAVAAVNDAPIVNRAPSDSLLFPTPDSVVALTVIVFDEESDSLRFEWLVDGSVQSGATDSTFSLTPDTASVDTVTVRVSDLEDTTSVRWIVDARRVPRITVNADSVRFGKVAFGDTASLVRRVGNAGHADLVISNLQVGNLEFSAIFAAGTVAASDSTTLELRFIPVTRGEKVSSIGFSTNDDSQSEISLSVAGSGTIPTTVSLDLDVAAGPQGVTAVDAAPGDTVSVDVFAAQAVDLIAYSLLLVFDPDVLSFSEYDARGTESSSLLEDAGNSLIPTVATPAGDRVRVQVDSQSSPQAASGDGFLGRVVFTVDSMLTAAASATIELQEVTLHSEGLADSDTLRPALIAQLDISALIGDFDRDGDVDFNDFFQLADHFGRMLADVDFDAAFDLDGDDTVGFGDFFRFADNFGTVAKAAATADGTDDGLRIAVVEGLRDRNRVELDVVWRGEEPLRGFATIVEFDPRHLEFLAYLPPARRQPLTLVRQDRSGELVFAAGLSSRQEPFAQRDIGRLEFSRLSPDETELRFDAAFTYTGADDPRLEAALPAAPLTVTALPADVTLEPPYPNPFNPETSIAFYLPVRERVVVRVFDVLGRPLLRFDEVLASGYHQWRWNGVDAAGGDVASGLYLVRFQAATVDRIYKLTLLK